MSTKHISSKRPDVKSVLKRKPLVQAIALALMAGCVAVPAWATSSIIVSRFADKPNQNGEMDTYEEGELFVGGTINLKSVNDPPEKPPIGLTVTSTGAGFFNNVLPGQYKIWQYLDPASYLASAKRQDGTPLVKWASEQNALEIGVADNQIINVAFPVPPLDLGSETEIQGAKQKVIEICSGDDVVALCDQTTTDCPTKGTRLVDSKWDSTKLITYNYDVVATYGTIQIETNSNRDPIEVWGLCNYGTLQSTQDNSLGVKYVELLANYGTITGRDSNSVYSSASSISLTSNWSNADGNVGDYYGIFYNVGTVQAGKGANSNPTQWYDANSVWRYYIYRSAGGSVNIQPTRIVQEGTIKAGQGGDYVVENYWNLWGFDGIPGKGGTTTITTLRSPDTNTQFMGVIATEQSETSSGRGGDVVVTGTKCEDVKSSCWREILGGEGGDLTITPAGSSITFKGKADSGKSAYIEPDMMLSGKDMRITAKEDVVIFGGNGWQLNLANLSDEAIVAGRNIVLAVGRGGKIDLRGNSSKVLKAAGKVQIYANNVLLDNGVRLEDLIDAQEIVKLGDKIIYHANLIGDQQVAGKAGDILPVNLTLHNVGPKVDTYTLSATSQNGWTVSDLPATVTVEGLKQTELNFNITLPVEGNDVITVTATSQADSTVVATMQVQAAVEKPVVVEPEKVALTVGKVGEGSVTAQGIDCGTDCTEDFAVNTEVKLTATPANGYEFANWSGDCASDTVTMDTAKSCSAQFTAVLYTTHGTLLDKAGKPLSAVTISTNGKTVTTNDAGYWEITDLTIGDHTFSATKEGYTFSNVALTLEGENTTQSVDIMVLSEPQGFYTTAGTLKDKAGNPIANATVQVGDKITMTDELGNWSIDGLFEGKYDIVATKDNFNCLNTDFELGNNDYHQVVSCEPVTTLKLVVKPSTYENLKQGEDLTYTATIINGGTQTATGVTLSNVLPEGATLVALESIEGQCNTETLVCSLPDLTPGATAEVKLTLHNDQTKTLKTVTNLTSTEYSVDMKASFKAVKPHLSVTLVDTPDPVVMQSALHYQAVVELSALAPEDTATDIAVVLQLPKGTELVDVTTEYGTCDSSAYPVITCQLNDLSVATPDSISRAVVDVNVKLTDASLLILTHEAKVSAANYPAHTDRERTNILVPPNAVADIVLVVDTTKSMDEELNSVIKAIEDFIKAQIGKGGVMPQVALVEFKDNVTLRAFTNDMNALLKSVRSLTVEGGGLCPEASAEALNLAISHTKEGGVIVFSTDAPPYPDADMAALTTRIKEKGIVLNALISDDCGDGATHWNDTKTELNQ